MTDDGFILPTWATLAVKFQYFFEDLVQKTSWIQVHSNRFGQTQGKQRTLNCGLPLKKALENLRELSPPTGKSITRPSIGSSKKT